MTTSNDPVTEPTTEAVDAPPAPAKPASTVARETKAPPSTAKPAKRRARARARKPASAKPPAPVVVLRYVGDGTVFQSGIPNRDVTTDDNLTDDLAELAVATGTHQKVS
jgi:hypothetical protein